MIEQCDDVASHLIDGVDTLIVRRSTAPSRIEDDHLVRFGQPRDLIREPDVSGKAGARHQHNGIPFTVDLVVKVDTS